MAASLIPLKYGVVKNSGSAHIDLENQKIVIVRGINMQVILTDLRENTFTQHDIIGCNRQSGENVDDNPIPK